MLSTIRSLTVAGRLLYSEKMVGWDAQEILDELLVILGIQAVSELPNRCKAVSHCQLWDDGCRGKPIRCGRRDRRLDS